MFLKRIVGEKKKETTTTFSIPYSELGHDESLTQTSQVVPVVPVAPVDKFSQAGESQVQVKKKNSLSNFKRHSSLNLRISSNAKSDNSSDFKFLSKSRIFRNKSLKTITDTFEGDNSNKEKDLNKFEDSKFQSNDAYRNNTTQTQEKLPINNTNHNNSPNNITEAPFTDSIPKKEEERRNADSTYASSNTDDNFIAMLDNISIKEHYQQNESNTAVMQFEQSRTTQDSVTLKESLQDFSIRYGTSGSINDNSIETKMEEITNLLEGAIQEDDLLGRKLKIQGMKNTFTFASSNLSNSSLTAPLDTTSQEASQNLYYDNIPPEIQEETNIYSNYLNSRQIDNFESVPVIPETYSNNEIFQKLILSSAEPIQNGSTSLSMNYLESANFPTAYYHPTNDKVVMSKHSIQYLDNQYKDKYEAIDSRKQITPPARSPRRPVRASTLKVSNTKNILVSEQINSPASTMTPSVFDSNINASDYETSSDRIFSTGNRSWSSLNGSIYSAATNKQAGFVPPPSIIEVRTGTSSNYSDHNITVKTSKEFPPLVTDLETITNAPKVPDVFITSNTNGQQIRKNSGKKFKDMISKRLSKITH